MCLSITQSASEDVVNFHKETFYFHFLTDLSYKTDRLNFSLLCMLETFDQKDRF